MPWVDLADGEPGALLAASDGEPELPQVDAGVDDHPLELWRLLHEDLVLAGRLRNVEDAGPLIAAVRRPRTDRS
jgi:hypothetical protein